jgi:hypothetical protein
MNALISAQSQSSTGSTSSASGSQSSSNDTSSSTIDTEGLDESAPSDTTNTSASDANLLEQLIQRQASAISLVTNPLSFNV